MDKKRWYPIPPYNGGTWEILNEAGELVARFESREDCEKAAELYNLNISRGGKD